MSDKSASMQSGISGETTAIKQACLPAQENWTWRFVEDLNEIIQSEQASALTASQGEYSTPFLTLQFLHLLATSQSVDGDSGWQSKHILIEDAEKKTAIALVPCYLKSHSYGEYVFDHSWAHAYQQHQLSYYPKLVCAIPFTPVSGARAILSEAYWTLDNSESSNKSDAILAAENEVFSFIADNKAHLIEQASASSLHILFPHPQLSDTLSKRDMHQRMSVQFVWQNQDYKCYEDFTNRLTSRKRRSIRKERKPFVETTHATEDKDDNALQIRTLSKGSLQQTHMDAFYLCYQQTYLKRSGHTGYLSAAFFDNLLNTMSDSLCIVAAFRGQRMIAGSLFFYNEHSLFGRYWGALEDVSGLHFECCYYRGIEFAIANKIQTFNPGTQGEHKILRGFAPTFCYSNHYMADPSFDRAVADFCERERPAVEQYHSQASEVLPYRSSEQ